MIDPELLNVLCCPVTRQALREASATELESLNAAIAQGTLKNHAGNVVHGSLEAALLTLDGKILYPVVQGIPTMLVDESIIVP